MKNLCRVMPSALLCLLGLVGLASCKPATSPGPATLPTAALDLMNLDITALQQRMAGGQLTSRQLTQAYLDRIAQLDDEGPRLNAVLALNPDALVLADQRDAERKAGAIRGPLHGIPVLLKDNIDTGDRQDTTAGSLALAGHPAASDAFLVTRLREAGAIILGKTNLSEWANFRSTRSSSGWSAAGGQTRNPHVLDRSPCGSSSGSGVAVAIGFAAAAVGTETDGSIVCPASLNGIVGFKPTVGLVSRSGIVPISHSQDTAGPMARSVRDAALLLDVMAGTDPQDAATTTNPPGQRSGFAQALGGATLRGQRIGIVRAIGGADNRGQAVLDAAVATLRAQGAVVVDPVSLPPDSDYGKDELTVLSWEFKQDLNAYLAQRKHPQVQSLQGLIDWNIAHAQQELPWFGQELLLSSQALGDKDGAAYEQARERARRKAGALGIDATLRRHDLVALVALTQSPAWAIDLVNGDNFASGFGASTPAAVAGYPHATVPGGFVHGLPVGVSFFAGAWQDARVLALAHAFEQVHSARQVPALRPSLALP